MDAQNLYAPVRCLTMVCLAAAVAAAALDGSEENGMGYVCGFAVAAAIFRMVLRTFEQISGIS